LEAAYRELVGALQEASTEAQKAAWERYRDYVRACQEAQIDSQTRAAEAHRSYLQTLYERQGTEEKGWEEEVQRKWADTLQEVQGEAQQRVAEAWQAFSEGGQQGSAMFERPYRRFLESVRDLWSRADPATLDPGSLTAIAQTLSAAAWSAQGALGAGR
jgi:hypothetical protein